MELTTDRRAAHSGTRLWVWSCGLLLLVGMLQLAIWPGVIGAKGGLGPYVRLSSDFLATLTAAQIISDGDGARLYDRQRQVEAQRMIASPYQTVSGDVILIYNHPPLEGLVVAALFALPAEVLYWLWTAASILACGAALWMLTRAYALPVTAQWVAIAAAAAFYPLHLSWWLGQNSALVLLGFCCLAAGLRRDDARLAGVGLALLTLKPQLLPIVGLYLVLERRWRTLVVGGAILGVLTVAAMPVLGVAWPLRYVNFLLTVPSQGAVVGVKPMTMHNWRGFVLNLLDDRAPSLVTPVYLAFWSASLLLLLVAWWFSRRAAGPGTPGRYGPLFALVCVTALLLSPHLNLHDLTMLIVPGWIVGRELVAGRWTTLNSRLGVGVLFAGYSLPLLTAVTATTDRVIVFSSITLLAVASGLLAWQCINPASTTGRTTGGIVPGGEDIPAYATVTRP